MHDDPSRIDLSPGLPRHHLREPLRRAGCGRRAHGDARERRHRNLAPGETLELANIEGPGTIRHIWMTFPPAPPETMRALWMEVFYDGSSEPSISVPCLDFFAMPLGRPLAYHSAMASAQEGAGSIATTRCRSAERPASW
ncbi:hypothetical protein [Candidatus Amarobacter glycogenicus]|uniref:hypothetical protein n=1 Tax=Candidatus Amarobacter glycogenicus TaxID=3140699 RepID=UPI0031CCBAA5